jgi:hypothetical protein
MVAHQPVTQLSVTVSLGTMSILLISALSMLHARTINSSSSRPADKAGDLLTNSIRNGVVTVTVNTALADGHAAMRNAITHKLNSDFKVSNPNQLANHVMYCLPSGTMNGIAYAHVNNWCTYVSAQMHGKFYSSEYTRLCVLFVSDKKPILLLTTRTAVENQYRNWAQPQYGARK